MFTVPSAGPNRPDLDLGVCSMIGLGQSSSAVFAFLNSLIQFPAPGNPSKNDIFYVTLNSKQTKSLMQ